MQGTAGSISGLEDSTRCSNWATSIYKLAETRTLEPMLLNERSHCKEKPTPQLENSPQAATKTPVQPKINFKNFI